MNHVLQYTQLRFKFDRLMKPEIPDSIPNGVINLWTLSRSTDWRDSQLKIVMHVEKKCFSSFGKSIPDEGRFCLELSLTFYFYF